MPFIKDDSVRRIIEASDIVEVVGDFVKLKQKGKYYTGCCPFHSENTPSFTVTSGSKQMYKCFGCGKGGDAIDFVRKHLNIEFVEAVEHIAKKYGIDPEYEAKEVNEAEVLESKQMEIILETAVKSYQDELMKMSINDPVPIELFKNRELSLDTIIDFKIGFAPGGDGDAGWKFLTTKFINGNMYPAATKLGIIQTKNASTFDLFRSRIMFPIQDHRGRFIGFGGRKLKPAKEPETAEEIKKEKENPKYINSAESRFYKKENVLFGLFQAAQAIKKIGYAILTEGYVDVISMHDKGANNTVATCGTSFTEAHAKLLKKYTQNVVIFYDDDKNKAGHKATMSAIDILIKFGFKIQVFINNTDIKNSLDPDDYARLFKTVNTNWINFYKELEESTETVKEVCTLYSEKQLLIEEEEQSNNKDEKPELLAEFEKTIEDGILFKCRSLLDEPKEGDHHTEQEAFTSVCAVLCLIEKDFLRTSFIDNLAKAYKIAPKQFTSEIKAIQELERKREEKLRTVYDDDFVLPKHVDRDGFMRDGFYTDDTPKHIGFYFVKGKRAERRTNFLLKPIMHIYSKDANENRRIVELDNGESGGRIAMEFPNVAFQSLEKFDSTVWQEGYYILFELDKNQLQKIKNKYANSFPKCWELKNLGWQPEGFWAYNNRLFNINTTQLETFNQYGIGAHKGINYYSPSASSINVNTRSKDNEYENDVLLTWVEAPIRFNEWCALMSKVYGDNGHLGILYVFVGLFRDIVYKLNNSCPFLYGYGQVQSGKTVWADSISAVFFKGMKAFNLNQGTDFAFFERLGRYYNCVITFNEFDENAVKDAWFRALKAAFDGEGREKGKSGTKNKTTSQKIEAAILLLGQYLSIKDDASVLSRSVPAPFSQTNERGDKVDFDRLKQYEEHGLAGMLPELLQYRKFVEDKFNDTYADQMKAIKAAIKEKGEKYKERIVQNYTVLVTMLELFKNKFDFPFSYETFFNYSVNNIINLSKMIESSNALSGFWKMVEFLLDQELIEEKWDFRIEVLPSVKVKIEGGTDRLKTFEKPTKILFIRLGNIHKLYSEQIRRQTGQLGLNEQTLQMYMQADPAYIGANQQMRFSSKITHKSTNTSSFMFDLDRLGINLERFNDIQDEVLPVTVTGTVGGNAKLVDVKGLPMVEFTLITKDTYKDESSLLPVEKTVYTKCVWTEVKKVEEIKNGMTINATGELRIKEYKTNSGTEESRRLIVFTLEIISKADPTLQEMADNGDLPF